MFGYQCEAFSSRLSVCVRGANPQSQVFIQLPPNWRLQWTPWRDSIQWSPCKRPPLCLQNLESKLWSPPASKQMIEWWVAEAIRMIRIVLSDDWCANHSQWEFLIKEKELEKSGCRANNAEAIPLKLFLECAGRVCIVNIEWRLRYVGLRRFGINRCYPLIKLMFSTERCSTGQAFCGSKLSRSSRQF